MDFLFQWNYNSHNNITNYKGSIMFRNRDHDKNENNVTTTPTISSSKRNGFVSLDVETANSNPRSICSIGLVKFIDGKIIDEYYSLLNPEEEFNFFNTKIHGIKSIDVSDSPTFPEIYKEIIKFIDDLPVVAHFAQFDIKALSDAAKKYEVPINDFSYFCSYKLSKKALPNQLNYKLNTLTQYFNIELEHHNALSDAKAAGQIVNKLIENCNHQNLYEFLDSIGFNVLNRFSLIHSLSQDSKSNKLSELVKLSEDEIAKLNQNHPFYNAHFVFTGKLESMTRKEAAAQVIQVGGIPENNLSKNTKFLVVGEQDFHVVGETGLSSKMKKANQLLEKGQNIELLTETDFLKLLNI